MDHGNGATRVAIKDGHGGKDVLYKRTDVSYRTDLADMFFEYFLKIHKYSSNMLKYVQIFS
jgi:hypothetical protein